MVHAKIASTVERHRFCDWAEFAVLDHLGPGAGDWFCCRAYIKTDGIPRIQCREQMNPGEALIVAQALHMAVDWLAEEMERRVKV
jgi:hypothetical protein